MDYLLFFVMGLVGGGVTVFFINRRNKRDLEKTFDSLSLNALTKNSEEFLKLANTALSGQAQAGAGELESRKRLIEQTVDSMKSDLKRVEEMVTAFERDRTQKYGELANQLRVTAEQTGKLQEVTGKLQTSLANSRLRGQWGERMAEDVLQLAGFIEGINYVRQKTLESSGSRPDYTFLLPQHLTLNMDVKFPMDNYFKYAGEEAEATRQAYKEQFLRDVRQRVKEVTTRDYVNPEANTVDYVLVFIPNEQVYCFIHENDRAMMDDAIKSKVILCSPLTLYAILAVIRQAVDNFKLESTAAEILSLLGTFNKQWELFKSGFDKMGQRIDDARKEFDKLMTTRSTQMEHILQKIDDLRSQRGIAATSGDGSLTPGETDEGSSLEKGEV
jgi:DNA recombination protein RmuC